MIEDKPKTEPTQLLQELESFSRQLLNLKALLESVASAPGIFEFRAAASALAVQASTIGGSYFVTELRLQNYASTVCSACECCIFQMQIFDNYVQNKKRFADFDFLCNTTLTAKRIITSFDNLKEVFYASVDWEYPRQT